MNQSFINHNTRKEFGITCLQYLVLDCILQIGPVGKDMIAGALGLSLSTTEQTIKSLEDYGLLSSIAGEYLLPTHIKNQVTGVDKATPKKKRKKEIHPLAEWTINRFNEINGTRYEPATYATQIDAVLKARNLTQTEIDSVLLHKYRTWGQDEGMRKYNAPTTIFRNAQRFLKYLDDARNYWAEMMKRDSSLYVEIDR